MLENSAVDVPPSPMTTNRVTTKDEEEADESDSDPEEDMAKIAEALKRRAEENGVGGSANKKKKTKA